MHNKPRRPDIFKKLFRSRREKPIYKIIAGEIKSLPKDSLSTDEENHIKAVLKEITNDYSNIGSVTFDGDNACDIDLVEGFDSIIKNFFEQIWYPEEAKRKRIEYERIVSQSDASNGPFIEPDWYIAFTPDFKNSIRNVDKKLQGRVLNAITHLAESPSTQVGDTVKPLSGELRGLWRIRIGNHRLIYRTDLSSKHIYLLSFGPRSGIYNA